MNLAAQDVRSSAHDCGFALVGLAPAEPLDPRPLESWLERGYGADMTAMSKRITERLDPSAVVPGAQTVIVLGIPYGAGEPGAPGHAAVARYARGRDYHYAHRDRMRALRARLLALDPSLPSLRTYACVDAGAAMEKAWAERAGLGFIGKNGVVINRTYGSWFTLSLMVIDRRVDSYDKPHARLCGTCDKCLTDCPTQAFPSPGVVDARRCLSYHTVENHAEIPAEIRTGFGRHVFGCDVCQEVCPFNHGELLPCDPRQAPRPLGHMTAAAIAALSEAEFDGLAIGTPMRRIGYQGLRRNACLALGAARDQGAAELLERLTSDGSPRVAEAATWALRRLRGDG
jgi:epoxyqueuosine reductase